MLAINVRSEDEDDSNPIAPLGYLAPLCVAIFFIFIWAIVGARHRYIRQNTGAHPLDPESLVSRGVITRGDVEKQFPLINYSTWWTSRNHHEAELKEIGTRTSTVSDRSQDDDDDGHDKNHPAEHDRVSAAMTDDATGDGRSGSSSGTPGGLEEQRRETEDADCLCAICMEGFEKGDMIRPLTCGHIFHPFCVDPWLTKRQACCPLCKKTFSHHRTSAEDRRIRTSFSALLPAPPGAVLLRSDIIPRNP